MPKITWICENGHEIELEMPSFEIIEPKVCDYWFEEMGGERSFEVQICKSRKFRRKYVPPALNFRGAGFYTTDNPKE